MLWSASPFIVGHSTPERSYSTDSRQSIKTEIQKLAKHMMIPRCIFKGYREKDLHESIVFISTVYFLQRSFAGDVVSGQQQGPRRNSNQESDFKNKTGCKRVCSMLLPNLRPHLSPTFLHHSILHLLIPPKRLGAPHPPQTAASLLHQTLPCHESPKRAVPCLWSAGSMLRQQTWSSESVKLA